MRVFDFDNTIYDGESVIDFYLFSLRRNPKVARYVPVVLYHLLRYKLGRTTCRISSVRDGSHKGNLTA